MLSKRSHLNLKPQRPLLPRLRRNLEVSSPRVAPHRPQGSSPFCVSALPSCVLGTFHSGGWDGCRNSKRHLFAHPSSKAENKWQQWALCSSSIVSGRKTFPLERVSLPSQSPEPKLGHTDTPESLPGKWNWDSPECFTLSTNSSPRTGSSSFSTVPLLTEQNLGYVIKQESHKKE